MIYFNWVFTLLILLVGIVVWLMLAHRKLKQELIVLREYVEGMKDDVAGLCSAAVSVDNRVANNNERLMDVVGKVDDFRKNEQSTSQPYHSAIQKVRSGVPVEELIHQSALSREEAVLLIHLHGASKQ